MNAALTSNAKNTLKQHGLEKEVETKIEAIYKAKGVPRPAYQGKLPEGNDGLGLYLLGVTGDQVLPARGVSTNQKPIH
jgi:methylmalonyl-CoA mutase